MSQYYKSKRNANWTFDLEKKKIIGGLYAKWIL